MSTPMPLPRPLARVPLGALLNDEGVIPMPTFVQHFEDGLLAHLQSTIPPTYQAPSAIRDRVLDGLKRRPFASQRRAVQALATLLVDQDTKLAVLNAEMGTGKTMMAICLAAVLHAEGLHRHLVLSPPHLVYKWRREILDTVPDARVWILNGSDCIQRLLQLRELLAAGRSHAGPEFFVLGRVRMRLGFHWRHAAYPRRVSCRTEGVDADGQLRRFWYRAILAACPHCNEVHHDADGAPYSYEQFLKLEAQQQCRQCRSPLWSLMRPRPRQDLDTSIRKALQQLPTIGPKRADQLVGTFGSEFLGTMLEDNIHEFVNLLDEDGELVFSDRQAERMERALSKWEFSIGGGAPYQPTEFIKRYLPAEAFATVIADEAHEYKGSSSAQGQAFAVLASKVSKVVLLTGSLMGGYADDLFYLLHRGNPGLMVGDGYKHNGNRSLATAAMAWMERYGVLKYVQRVSCGEERSFRTARGKSRSTSISRAPGFSPVGLARYLLPYTVFLKLRDIDAGALPSYTEQVVQVPLSGEMAIVYDRMRGQLSAELRAALARGDRTLLGKVLMTLLAWPETCFREESVVHSRTKQTLFYSGAVLGEDPSPKEAELIALCRSHAARGRRVLVYTVYTDTRDHTARLKQILVRAGLKAVVLRSTVPTDKREDWILEQVDQGCQVLICNPELVKTGLDLLEFPTLVFLSTGYNTFTLQQASRRSWRIGQRQEVLVVFFAYADTAQIACLQLMGRKIAVTQSTAGDMPDTGLEVLDDEGDSLEVALAKQLVQSTMV